MRPSTKSSAVMTGLPFRRRITPKLFGSWAWLLLAIFLLASQSNVLAANYCRHSTDTLAAPSLSPDLVAAPAHAPPAGESLPAPFEAPPSHADLTVAAATCRTLQKRDASLLPSTTIYPASSLPRPPPLT